MKLGNKVKILKSSVDGLENSIGIISDLTRISATEVLYELELENGMLTRWYSKEQLEIITS